MNELEKILKSFYEVSGMNMTIFDKDQHVITSYPKKKSPFCLLLDNNKDAKKKCTSCDYQAMEHVKKTGSLYIYQCWCGLYEAIMPLYTYGQISGYIMMGQILDKDSDSNDILSSTSKYLSSSKESIFAIKNTSSLTKKQIKAYSELILLCAKYITMTNSVEVNSEDLAEDVQSYLVHHYSEDISIDYLCHYFHVSKGTLHSHFKNTFHTTIHKRLLSIRIEEARKLLTSTKLSIKEVSLKVGFQDPDYFSKTYKKIYGISPTQTKKYDIEQ